MEDLLTVGTYDPIKGDDKVTIDEDKALQQLKNGAQPTDTERNILFHDGIMTKYAETKKNKQRYFMNVVEFKEYSVKNIVKEPDLAKVSEFQVKM